jgi:hypothetical protein
MVSPGSKRQQAIHFSFGRDAQLCIGQAGNKLMPFGAPGACAGGGDGGQEGEQPMQAFLGVFMSLHCGYETCAAGWPAGQTFGKSISWQQLGC